MRLLSLFHNFSHVTLARVCMYQMIWCTVPNVAKLVIVLSGVNQWQSDKPARYVSNTDLSSRVASLNPPWNGDQTEAASNAQFQNAMQLTGKEFMDALNYYGTVSNSLAQAMASYHHCHQI